MDRATYTGQVTGLGVTNMLESQYLYKIVQLLIHSFNP